MRTRTTTAEASTATSPPAVLLNTGVWIDTKEAVIITLGGKAPVVRTVQADMERHKQILTTKNTGARAGTRFINMEGKMQEKLDHESVGYCKKVINELGQAGTLVVFGPAQVKHELHKALLKDPQWKKSVIAVETADSMTRNQMVAWVKKYFAGSAGA